PAAKAETTETATRRSATRITDTFFIVFYHLLKKLSNQRWSSHNAFLHSSILRLDYITLILICKGFFAKFLFFPLEKSLLALSKSQ
ncbi:MAG: hypothetical protein IIY54_00620, partial [Ruminococcus sp.]|nr:hypothetical protein [Ruminococcus sp.]